MDKVFIFGTPHNGIEVAGANVPEFLGVWDMNNFNREKMASYLNLKKGSESVHSLDGKFDPSRFFCLIGTNHKDYNAAKYAVGPMSDGLVKIKMLRLRKHRESTPITATAGISAWLILRKDIKISFSSSLAIQL